MRAPTDPCPPHRARALLLTVTALSAACTSSSNDLGLTLWAITQGQDDPADPAVIALRARGEVVCTGTAIAPRVVLTAAHCIAGVAVADLAVERGGERIAVTHALPHPLFDASFFTDDVGLVLLASAVIAPEEAPPRAGASLGETALGAQVRIVGYGRDDAQGNLVPQKREGVAVLDQLRARELLLGPGPSLPCTGDSGGPAFVTRRGVEELAGVASRGDPDCARTATYGRVDVHEDDFIGPYLAATSTESAALGEVCYDDTNCAEGVCAPGAADETGTCRIPCEADGACPVHQACRAVSDVDVCVPAIHASDGGCAIAAAGGSDAGPGRSALALALGLALLALGRRRRGSRR